MTSPSDATDLLRQVHELINNSFGVEDLRTLCFQLGVVYDDLPAQGRSNKARELVLLLAQEGRLDELAHTAKRMRPRIDWPDVPAGFVFNTTRFTELQPLSKQEQLDREKKLILLEKVKRAWIDGVLAKTVVGGRHIKIYHQPFNLAVADPWQDVKIKAVDDDVGRTEVEAVYKPIETIFQASGRALLILGSPGSGKTVTLLKLTEQLIADALNDPGRPIPVVLNLGSWSESRGAINNWVIEELVAKYLIPREDGRRWLEDNQLILLLDGLDDIDPEYRGDCIRAINHFRTEHGFTGIAICSRAQAYMATDIRLQLDQAILLQELSMSQVNEYLDLDDQAKNGLRRLLEDDAGLQEMIRSPLMLNLIRQTYGGSDGQSKLEQDITTGDIQESTTKQRNYLFASYVDRMFQRYGEGLHISLGPTKRWLSWLAQNMLDHNQTVFLLEQLQPSWIRPRSWRWIYILLARLIDGLVIGLLLWLLLINRKQVQVSLFMQMYEQIGEQLPFSFPLPFWIAIGLNLLMGLVVGLLDIFFFEQNERRQLDKQTAIRVRIRQTAIIGVVIAALSAVLLLALGAPRHELAWLTWSAYEALLFALLSYILHGVNYRTDVRTVEALSWSWSRALPAAGIGLLIGIGVIPINLAVRDDVIVGQMLRNLPAWTFIPALLAGLQGRRLEKKTRPNEGVRLSLRNGSIAASLFFILVGLYGFWLLEGSIAVGIVTGLTVAVGAFWIYGGNIALKHGLLRLALFIHLKLPGHLAQFLDDATDCVYLHKVGGGYIFIHRSLQEYFASLRVAIN